MTGFLFLCFRNHFLYYLNKCKKYLSTQEILSLDSHLFRRSKYKNLKLFFTEFRKVFSILLTFSVSVSPKLFYRDYALSRFNELIYSIFLVRVIQILYQKISNHMITIFNYEKKKLKLLQFV